MLLYVALILDTSCFVWLNLGRVDKQAALCGFYSDRLINWAKVSQRLSHCGLDLDRVGAQVVLCGLDLDKFGAQVVLCDLH